MLKKGARVLALDDSPFTRKDSKTRVVGLIGRDAGIEGVVSFDVRVDGDDATKNLISRVKSSRFNGQIKLIAMNGVSFGGMNIVDLVQVNKGLGIPVIAITRKRPRRSLFIDAMKKIQPSQAKRKAALIKRMKEGSETVRIRGFYVQCFGIDAESAEKFFNKSLELIRLCHLIAGGVSKGESTGRL